MAGRITQEELRILNQAQEGKNSYPGLEEQQPYAFDYFFNKQILHSLSFKQILHSLSFFEKKDTVELQHFPFGLTNHHFRTSSKSETASKAHL